MSGGPAGPTLVVAAMPEELRSFRRASGRGRHPVALLGETATRAASALERSIERHAPARVLVLGVCGGLAPDLEACDLLLPDAVGTPEEAAPPPDADWLARLRGRLDARSGRLVSIERVAASAEAKRALAERLGPEALAVDLETAALARVARARGVPYLVIRAVSDTVGESMPGFVARCFRADGSMNRWAVVRSALLRRRRWKVLRAMHRRMSRCSDALSRAAGLALEA